MCKRQAFEFVLSPTWSSITRILNTTYQLSSRSDTIKCTHNVNSCAIQAQSGNSYRTKRHRPFMSDSTHAWAPIAPLLLPWEQGCQPRGSRRLRWSFSSLAPPSLGRALGSIPTHDTTQRDIRRYPFLRLRSHRRPYIRGALAWTIGSGSDRSYEHLECQK